MFKRFEFIDEKSNKFWEVSVESQNLIVNFGRIGTNGQTKTKNFETTELVIKEMEKLIKEKTKKGYIKIN